MIAKKIHIVCFFLFLISLLLTIPKSRENPCVKNRQCSACIKHDICTWYVLLNASSNKYFRSCLEGYLMPPGQVVNKWNSNTKFACPRVLDKRRNWRKNKLQIEAGQNHNRPPNSWTWTDLTETFSQNSNIGFVTAFLAKIAICILIAILAVFAWLGYLTVELVIARGRRQHDRSPDLLDVSAIDKEDVQSPRALRSSSSDF